MKRLKELRIEANLTQAEVAKRLSTNQTTIGKYERGDIQPSIETLKKLSSMFEVSIDYLVNNSDDFGNISIPAPTMKADSQELLRIFESLDPMHREQILEYARYFADRSAKAGKKDKKNVAT